MKNIFLALAAVLMAHSATAQVNYPQGIYMSLEEIVSKTPSVKDSAQIVKLKGCPNDRNDYVLKSDDKKTKKLLKKKAWAYSDGDTLYLNGSAFKVQKGYTKLISNGRYLLFHAAMTKQRAAFYATAQVVSGVAIGLLTGFIVYQHPTGKRYHYAYDTETNELHTITLDFLDKELPNISQEGHSDFKNDVNFMKKANPYQKAYLKKMIIAKYTPLLNYEQNDFYIQ